MLVHTHTKPTTNLKEPQPNRVWLMTLKRIKLEISNSKIFKHFETKRHTSKEYMGQRGSLKGYKNRH